MAIDSQKKVTSDRNIISWPKGVSIDFVNQVDQNSLPWPYIYNDTDRALIDKGIQYVLLHYAMNGFLPFRPGSNVVLFLSHTICNIYCIKPKESLLGQNKKRKLRNDQGTILF